MSVIFSNGVAFITSSLFSILRVELESAVDTHKRKFSFNASMRVRYPQLGHVVLILVRKTVICMTQTHIYCTIIKIGTKTGYKMHRQIWNGFEQVNRSVSLCVHKRIPDETKIQLSDCYYGAQCNYFLLKYICLDYQKFSLCIGRYQTTTRCVFVCL